LSLPFPKPVPKLALPGAIGIGATAAALSGQCYGMFALCFPAAFIVLCTVLPTTPPSGMRMTNVEHSMAVNTLYGPAQEVPPAYNVINAMTFHKKCPSLEQILEPLKRVVAANKRFRAVPEGWTWREVELKVEDHVTQHKVATEAEAVALAKKLMQVPEFSNTRPMWCLESIEAAQGRSVVVMRIHHAVGDGIGLFQCMQQVLSKADGTPIELPNMGMPPCKPMSLGKRVLYVLDCVRSFVKVVLNTKGPLETDTPWTDPTRKTLTGPRVRDVAFFPPLSLPYVKKVKAAAGATVNDVIFSAWAGAVRRHCEAHGFDVSQKILLRANLAIALPRDFPKDHDPEDRLVNNFYFATIPAEVTDPTPLGRLKKNKASLDVVKKTTLAIAGKFVASHFGYWLPTKVKQDSLRDLMMRHHCVFSNVPGSPTDMRAYGELVDELHGVFLNTVPQFLGISVGEKIFVNITADPNVIKGLTDEFPKLFVAELEALGKEVGVDGSCLAP